MEPNTEPREITEATLLSVGPVAEEPDPTGSGVQPIFEVSERVLPLREAAELCGTTYTALRKRADRGSLRTVKRGNVRMVPLSELEREGLVPAAEERRLRARVEELERELSSVRLLTERAESELTAEREARERAEAAMFKAHAGATIATEHLEARERELEEIRAAAGGILGPIRAWRRVRALEAVGS